MADSIPDDSGEIGPVEQTIWEKEAKAIRELLGQALKVKAAGRIEELQAELARRIGEMKRIVVGGGASDEDE